MNLTGKAGSNSTRRTVLTFAAAFAAVVASVAVLALFSEPAVYLTAMGTVLAVELLAVAILFARRIGLRGRGPRRLPSRPTPPANRASSEKLQIAADRLRQGFIEEPRAVLTRAAADSSLPRSARSFAEQVLREAEEEDSAPPQKGREHFDVVIVSNFNLPGGTTSSNANEIRLLADGGKKVGLFHHPLYKSSSGRPVNRKISDLVDGRRVRFVQPRSALTCDLLILRFPPFAARLREDLPSIEAREKILVVNQAPMNYYDVMGGRKPVWDPAEIHENLLGWIGDHRWTAVGPAVRRALVDHHAEAIERVDLAEEFWYPTMSIEGAEQRPNRPPSNPIRIGRHSRDHVSKWPELAADLRACYPDGPEFEIRVLGGAEAPRRILGRLPENWSVYEFDSMNAGDFLRDLDFYVYFPCSTLLEAFGRAPVEAMGSGVPTILPPEFEPVFGDGAIYAEPSEVRGVVTALAEDPHQYAVQQKLGLETVYDRFGSDAHRERFRALGIEL